MSQDFGSTVLRAEIKGPITPRNRRDETARSTADHPHLPMRFARGPRGHAGGVLSARHPGWRDTRQTTRFFGISAAIIQKRTSAL